MKPGSEVFFRDPDCETRQLLRSTVVAMEPDSFDVQLENDGIVLEVGTLVIVYFDGPDEPMQLGVEVTEIHNEEGPVIAKLSPVGDAVSAEPLDHYRVSTLPSNIVATLNNEPGCAVQDVSATGFAVLATAMYAVGTNLPASIEFEGESYSGLVSIQSHRQLRPGKVRYGLRAVNGPESGDLATCLNSIGSRVRLDQRKRA